MSECRTPCKGSEAAYLILTIEWGGSRHCLWMYLPDVYTNLWKGHSTCRERNAYRKASSHYGDQDAETKGQITATQKPRMLSGNTMNECARPFSEALQTHQLVYMVCVLIIVIAYFLTNDKILLPWIIAGQVLGQNCSIQTYNIAQTEYDEDDQSS